MMHNMGQTDKLLRMLLAAIMILVGFLTGTFWLPLLAFIPLITIFFSFCPIYAPFKINTMEKQKISLGEDKKITIKQEDLQSNQQTTFIESKPAKNKVVKKKAKKVTRKKSEKKK